MEKLIKRIESDIARFKYQITQAEFELEKEKEKDKGDLFNLNGFGRGYRTAMLNAEKERLQMLEDYLQILKRSEISA